jgi:DNA repair protein RadA/Sms
VKTTKGSRSVFACQECGNQSTKWLGRCPECGNWNTYVEEQVRTEPSSRAGAGRRAAISSTHPMPLADVQFTQANRLRLGMRELNQVLGGGIVPGSLVLIGGDPGIGKSTLLLQLAGEVASTFGPVLYVSGEESVQQLKLRAQRLGIQGDRLMVLAENDLVSIIEHLETSRPMAAVIDSIQTVFLDTVTSAPGSVSQVRECAGRLMLLAKSSHIPIFLVGHVNKEGAIAGPRVLEHIVDTVLYLEGERHHSFRILRSQKNRFGSTDEIGVFEMRDTGMHEVSDPSRAFLQDRSLNEVGNVVHVALEGSRPLLVELQSLTSPSRFGPPRRSANGIDLNRLHMLIAVLERRAHLDLGQDEIFLNAAGGVKLSEPAADLAIALAIASNKRNRPVGADVVAIGELGLSGELRRVNQLDRRLLEAHRLGFKRAVIPAAGDRRDGGPKGMQVSRAETIADAIRLALAERPAGVLTPA